jgi:gliding motility-associated-like protein
MTNYTWNVSSGGTITSGSTTNVITVDWTDAGAQTVSVNYINGNGCTALSPTNYAVTVQAIPESPLVRDYTTCATNGMVTWSSLITQASGGSIRWYEEASGGAPIAPEKVDKSIVGETTKYASVINSIGCESPRVPATVTVNSIPIASVDKTDIANIQIEATNGTSPYEYSVYNKTGTFLGSMNVGMLTFGMHELTVTDANECKTKINFYIDPVPLIPDKFFTPNEDNNNTVWNVQNIEFYPKTEIYLYDRFGKELAMWKGVDFKGWDGVYKGNPMPTTDYWYVIEVKETGKRLVGHFLLKR